MTEIGRDDRADNHDWCNIGQELRASFVCQVGQHWNVLLVGFVHAISAQRKCRRPDEKHGENRQQRSGNQDDLRRLLFGVIAVKAFCVQHELRNCRQEAKRKHQHGHDQDDVAEVSDETVGTVVVERAEIPLRDQVQRHCCQRHDQRVDHELRDQQRGVAT